MGFEGGDGGRRGLNDECGGGEGFEAFEGEEVGQPGGVVWRGGECDGADAATAMRGGHFGKL